jgi:signal transduction histidine kinase
MTPARRWAGYGPEVATDLRVLFGRHGVSVLATCFAAGALVEDLVSPTATLGAGRYDRGPEVVIAAVLAAAVALVALRNRLGVVAPLSALALLGLASLPAPAWLLDSSFVYLLVMLICGLGGYLAQSRWSHAAGLLVLLAVGSLAAGRHPDPHWGQAAGVIAFMAIAWVAGTIVRGPVLRAHSAEVRAVQLEQEQAEAARQAVIDERQRIARELHDVIAHSVSVMTVMTGAVRRRLTPDQTRERDSLVAVERTGREALAEMRRLVGMLHEEETMPSYAPQPGMQALDTLIDTVRAAGLPVDLQVEGARRELPPGVDLAAYRVVQEALTNTLKHAGPASARVQICWTDDELRIEVANNGRNTAPSAGYGQAGMRERMRLYGGRLESGPRTDGGYVVRAYLPTGSGA